MNLFLDEYMVQPLNVDFKERFRDAEQKSKVVQALYTWLIDVARKKPLPDLEQRCLRMQREFEVLVENMEVKIHEGKWVVKAAGSAEGTLQKLRLGTSWFDGNPDVIEVVLTGLFNL